MNWISNLRRRATAAAATAMLGGVAVLAGVPQGAAAATLSGWAWMPANTFSDGPTSGQFAGAGAGGNPLPLLSRQPVQGLSAVLAGPAAGTYVVMTDNGFGTHANSADTLLRLYTVAPDFKTATGGSGTVSAADFHTGALLPAFSAASRITLSDPNRLLGFTLQADLDHYYGVGSNPAVDASIRSGRLLTGADLDTESVRLDKNGHYWFGDEFGPFLVKTDAQGQVLRAAIPLPGVQAPQNPFLGSGTANLAASGGFEGMAVNAAGDTLYTLLEKTVAGDGAKLLRINAFDIDAEAYTGQQWLYPLEADGVAIGDMTAVNAHQFLVIERNNATGSSGVPFKKVYLIDLRRVDALGRLVKTEVVDLMALADPMDLNGDGSTSFTFPYVTIEDVLVLSATELLVVNDNNYPGTGGRAAGVSDHTEFLRITLDQPLAVPEPGTLGLGLLAACAAAGLRRRRPA